MVYQVRKGKGYVLQSPGPGWSCSSALARTKKGLTEQASREQQLLTVGVCGIGVTDNARTLKPPTQPDMWSESEWQPPAHVPQAKAPWLDRY